MEHLTGTAGSASLGVTVSLRVVDPLEPVVYPWVFKAEGSWSRSPNRIAAFTSTICLKANTEIDTAVSEAVSIFV